MSTTDDFEAAQARAKTLKKNPGNDQLLELYALYKQGKVGDVDGKRPGMLDIKGRAKFDAWAARRGTAKDAAQKSYVELVDRLVAAD